MRILKGAKEAAIREKTLYHLKLWSATSCKPRKEDTNNLTEAMILPISKQDSGTRKASTPNTFRPGQDQQESKLRREGI